MAKAKKVGDLRIGRSLVIRVVPTVGESVSGRGKAGAAAVSLQYLFCDRGVCFVRLSLSQSIRLRELLAEAERDTVGLVEFARGSGFKKRTKPGKSRLA